MDWNTWKKNIWKIVVMRVFETVIAMDDAEEFKDKGVFDKEDDQEHIVKDVLVPVLEPVFYIKKEYIV